MKNPTDKNIPQHLSREAKAWWKKLCEEYDLADSNAKLLLESALSSFDRWQEARHVLKKEGLTTLTRFGVKTTHPCVGVERDAKAAMLRALRELHLPIGEIDPKVR